VPELLEYSDEARRFKSEQAARLFTYCSADWNFRDLRQTTNGVLQTTRLLLREFTPQDADALALVLSDPETMRYYPAPYDRAGVEQWIERNRQRYRDDGVGLWAMELTKTPDSELHEIIGDCGIILQEVEGERLYEIGYHLRRDFWGQGLATEAAIACRDWAFAHLKADRLISLIRPENLPSRRVAERIGMTVWKEVNWRGLPHCVYSIERGKLAALAQ
jgi:[ribosomal protein S5]-alanine N-acetyltransferase